MKKSVLVTSVLFSTMMLGTNMSHNTNVKASERTEVAGDGIISNKIKFIDQDGIMVRPNVGDQADVYGNCVVSGKIGNSIQLDDILPKGYELNDKTQILNFGSNNGILFVKVNAKKITTTVNFVNEEGEKLNSIQLSGKVGDRKVLPKESVPEGYHILYSSVLYGGVALSFDEKEIDIKIVKNPIQKNVNLNFVDDKGKIISSKIYSYPIGERVDIQNVGLPEDYELSNNQLLNFPVNNDVDSVNINVKKVILTNILDLAENDKIIDSFKIKGKFGMSVDILRKIPRQYDLVNSNDKNMIIRKDGDHIIVKVIKNTVRNKIEFVTADGKLIDNYHNPYFYGKVGELKKIEPVSGYKIIKNDTIKLNSKDGYVHTIVLEGKKVDTELLFFENGRADKEPISKEKYSGKFGDDLPNKYIPDGYVLLYGKYQITDAQPTQKVLLRKIVKTKVNYINSFGVIIGKQEFIKPNHVEVQLSVPKGYLLVNNPNNVLRIDRDISVQNVLVVPTNGVQMPELPNIVSTQINLINRKDNKVIHSYVAQGIHGQSMNIQIPTGYDLAKGVANKLTLDKSKKLVNIYMVEKEVTNTTGVTVPHSKTVLTKKTAHLYDKNGKEVTNRALGVNSGWKSDQMMVLNGETYYRVATNEYVKVSDIVEYQMNVSTVKTSSGSAKYLYDVNGKKSSDRALAANTAWFTDKAAVINGEKMYRVATNEWVKASDID